MQLVDVAEGSSRTVWKLEGKQVRFLDNEKESEKHEKHCTDNDNAGLLGSLKTSRWFG